MKDDKTYLRHILEAIESIESYLGGVTYEEFASNKMMIDAVVRELEIVGEASSKLSEGFRDEHDNMAFRDATEMRNFLIHEYFGVNIKVVWDTCKNDVPKLKDFIEKLLDA